MSSVDYHSDEKQDVHSPIHQKTRPVALPPQDASKTSIGDQRPLRDEQPAQRLPQAQRLSRTQQQSATQDRAPSITDNAVFQHLFDARQGAGLTMQFDLNTTVSPDVKETREYVHSRSLEDKYDSHSDGPAVLNLPSFSSLARSKGNILEDGTLVKEFLAATNLISTMIDPIYRAPIIGEIGSHLTPFVIDNLDHDINTSYYSNNTIHFDPGPLSWFSSSKRKQRGIVGEDHPARDFDINRYYYLREHGGKVPYLTGSNTVLSAVAPILFGKTTTRDFSSLSPGPAEHVSYHNQNNDAHQANYDSPAPLASLIQGQHLLHQGQHPPSTAAVEHTLPINSRIYTNKPFTMRNIIATRGAGNTPRLMNDNEQYKMQQLKAHQFSEEEHKKNPHDGGLYAIRVSPDLSDKPTIRITTPFSGTTTYSLDNTDGAPLSGPVVNRIARNIAIQRNRYGGDLNGANTRRLDKELLESLNVSVAEVAREQLNKQYDLIYSTAKGESEVRLKELQHVLDLKAEEGNLAHKEKQRAINAALHDYDAQLQAAHDRYKSSVKKEKEEHESLTRALAQQQRDLQLQLKMHDENLKNCERELSLKRQEYRENKQFVGSPQELTDIENRRLAELRQLRDDADRKLHGIRSREEHAIEEHKRRLHDYKLSLDEHSRLYETRKQELSDLEKHRQHIAAKSSEQIEKLNAEIQHQKAQREKEFMRQSREIQSEIDHHQSELSTLEKEYRSQSQDLLKKQNELKGNINILKTERERAIEQLNREIDNEKRAYEEKRRRLHDSLADAEKHLQKAKESYEQIDRIANERIIEVRRQMNEIELELCGEVVDVVERVIPREKEVTVIEEKRIIVPAYETHYDTVITTTNSKGEVIQKVIHDHHPDPSIQKQIDHAKKVTHSEGKKEDKGILQTIKDTFTANAKARPKRRVDHDFHASHNFASRYSSGNLLSNTLLDSETDEEIDQYNIRNSILSDTDDEY